MKTYVFIDRQAIVANKQHNACSPPICVTTSGNPGLNRAGCRVKIHGPCEVIYDKAGVVFPGHESVVTVVTEAPVELIEGYGK